MKIYISGKITGTTDYQQKFDAAKELIITKGHEPISPLDIHHIFRPETTTWEQYMLVDLGMLRASDAILLLPDWGNSKGARIEYGEAVRMRKKIYYKIEDIEQKG